MAALALITERPKVLEHIVLTKTVNKEGIYLIRICHNGLWKTVIVDDCFPCTQYKQLAYAKASRRQLYAPLIEKACAKDKYYCAPIAGILSGVLWGIPLDMYRNHGDDAQFQSIRDAANKLGNQWTLQPGNIVS